jgi:glycerol-3-phosphate acyltransferase PlsY
MIDTIAAAAGGYALGCVCAGYYLVLLLTAGDVRRCGSGVTGATNVGRCLGPGGFAVTFVLDGAKGVAVAWALAHWGFDASTTAIAILATVCGHIWPLQLGFRGGKGIATSLGAFAVYDARIVLVIAGVFVVCLLLLRLFVISGLLAYVLAPLLLVTIGLPGDRLLTTVAVAGVILIAHRNDIRAALAERGAAPAHPR